MGTVISKKKDLEKVLRDINDQVVKAVSKRVSKLLEQRILQDVYFYDGVNSVYARGTRKPTFQFLKAWKWTALRKEVDARVTELFYDYSGMDYEPENWVHGSTLWGDSRSYLHKILNVDGYTSSLTVAQANGDWSGDRFGYGGRDSRPFSKYRQPYWDNTLAQLFDDGELEKMFVEEYDKFGIKRS